jgi:UDP-glucuronate decarboxylase
VISNFIMQALLGKDITVHGRGSQTRSFCYVDDLIDAFVLMMNTSEDVTGPINIGNPSEFTILEIAKKIIALTGSSSKIVRLPLPEDDPKQRRPDIQRARDTLGWEPAIALEEGLKRTIKYFETLLVQQNIKIL